MRDIDESLRRMLEHSECLVSGYLDVESGKLVTLQTVALGASDPATQRAVEVVALAAAELLQRSNTAVQVLQSVLARAPLGASDPFDGPQEVIMRAASCLHIVLRSRARSDRALVMAFSDDVNAGMALSESRLALYELDRLRV